MEKCRLSRLVKIARLATYEEHMEIAQYTEVSIWWMLDGIQSRNCRTALALLMVEKLGRNKIMERCYICLHLGSEISWLSNGHIKCYKLINNYPVISCL